MSDKYYFTEEKYITLLDKAKCKYHFNGSDLNKETPAVCWRHDIDYSPHRALSMARYEAKRKLRCVYHILCSSRYYNILEPEIALIIKEIASLGHEIGLHLDFDVFGGKSFSKDDLFRRINLEKDILENLINQELISISFHNHALNINFVIDDPYIEGLLNLASTSFYKNAKYISDSNGIWRQEDLETVLDGSIYERLHVLTHPVWWPPESLLPIDRVLRVINGRARANKLIYITTMKRDGRLEKIAKAIGLTDEDLADAGISMKNDN